MFFLGIKFFVCVALAIGGGYCLGVYGEKRLRPGGRNPYGYLIVGLALLLVVCILVVVFTATS